MAFGQQKGPPASARQIDEITLLLEQAGYTSFREARHIFGLTQRQAAGSFTQGEAVELIERLTVVLGADAPEGTPGTDRQAEMLAAVPAEDLADELVRRGWMCMPPA